MKTRIIWYAGENNIIAKQFPFSLKNVVRKCKPIKLISTKRNINRFFLKKYKTDFKGALKEYFFF